MQTPILADPPQQLTQELPSGAGETDKLPVGDGTSPSQLFGRLFDDSATRDKKKPTTSVEKCERVFHKSSTGGRSSYPALPTGPHGVVVFGSKLLKIWSRMDCLVRVGYGPHWQSSCA